MFNPLLFFLRLVWIKATGKSLPLTVIFNVTNRCNLRCQHCYASYFKRNSKNEMTTKQIKKLIKDLKDNGCLRISISGGEPLLRKDIGQIIDFTKSLGISVTLDTNGILIPQHLADLNNLDFLAVSLDGKPEHHDLLRGKGSGTKALKGIKRALEAGLRVNVNMVINKYNLNDIDYLLDLAKKLGFKAQFALAISNIFGEKPSAEDIKPKNSEFRKVLRRIIAKKKNGAPILFSALAYESVLNCWPDFQIEGVIGNPAPKGMPPCPAGRFFGLIDADGTLWACPHLIGKIKAENALKVGVAEAWRIANNHPCRGCYQVYHHEFSLLMSLKPAVLWNYFKLAYGNL